MAWIKDPAIVTMKTAIMAKKITRVRIRARRVERPLLSNQWRSVPKISVRYTDKRNGPRIDDAACIPASIITAAARVIRVPETLESESVGFMESGFLRLYPMLVVCRIPYKHYPVISSFLKTSPGAAILRGSLMNISYRSVQYLFDTSSGEKERPLLYNTLYRF